MPQARNSIKEENISNETDDVFKKVNSVRLKIEFGPIVILAVVFLTRRKKLKTGRRC